MFAWGVSAKGAYLPRGVSLRAVSLLEVLSAQGVCMPRGVSAQRDVCLGGVWPWGYLCQGVLAKGCLARGVYDTPQCEQMNRHL